MRITVLKIYTYRNYMCRSKTKFRTVYPTIYLHKFNRLENHWLCIAHLSDEDMLDYNNSLKMFKASSQTGGHLSSVEPP